MTTSLRFVAERSSTGRVEVVTREEMEDLEDLDEGLEVEVVERAKGRLVDDGGDGCCCCSCCWWW